MEILAIKTFQQLSKSYFLDYYGKNASPVTVNAKKVQLNGNILPVIGQKRLKDISKYDIRDIFNAMGRKKLTNRYIRMTWNTGRDICDYGMLIGVMKENPFLMYIPETGEADEFEPFSSEEMKKIREVISQGRYRNLYEFILESGFMKQEALGLYWDDVDFERGEVTVRRRYISENRNYVLKEYKSEHSPLRLSKDALECLIAERSKQDIRKKLAKDEWNSASCFVFTDEHGRPVEPEAPTTEMNRLARMNGMKRLSMRNLRNQYLAEHC